jgi:hypothetical protein
LEKREMTNPKTMPSVAGVSSAGEDGRVPWVFLIVIVCLLIGWVLTSWEKRLSLDRFDRAMAIELLKSWRKAGQPEGRALTEFMQGGAPDTIVSNCEVTIDGTEYQTIFAVTNARSHRVGTLFVTKGDALIWVDARGQPTIEPK